METVSNSGRNEGGQKKVWKKKRNYKPKKENLKKRQNMKGGVVVCPKDMINIMMQDGIGEKVEDGLTVAINRMAEKPGRIIWVDQDFCQHKVVNDSVKYLNLTSIADFKSTIAAMFDIRVLPELEEAKTFEEFNGILSIKTKNLKVSNVKGWKRDVLNNINEGKYEERYSRRRMLIYVPERAEDRVMIIRDTEMEPVGMFEATFKLAQILCTYTTTKRILRLNCGEKFIIKYRSLGIIQTVNENGKQSDVNEFFVPWSDPVAVCYHLYGTLIDIN